MRANLHVFSAIEDTETYSSFAQSGKQFLTKLKWHMDRAMDLEKTIKTALSRAEHNLCIAQQSRREWVSRSSLKILFIFENFFRSVAYSLLVFLPEIFVSAFFSSSFFGPDGDLGSLWIFFVDLFPLTLITIFLNGAWYRLLAGLWSLEGFRLRDTHKVAHEERETTQIAGSTGTLV
ncbi:hypothetical protein DER46DRAFT_612887 [Fusarium sp. MPI-SDFR-AT-0072]|nr:hypothetical protein DER46DRAFT_612887 [Fusarium sp. MPI-SDFR-AT-0072]